METSALYNPHRLFLERETTMPPHNDVDKNSSDYLFTTDGNFDSNTVIVLVALLCALLCALAINSIARLAGRCGYGIGFETSQQVAAVATAAAAADSGLKESELEQIPVVSYKSGLRIQVTDCPICLGEFSEGEKVRVLPKCHHGFHVKCIDKWLLSQSSCPLCRRGLELDDQSTNYGDLEEG